MLWCAFCWKNVEVQTGYAGLKGGALIPTHIYNNCPGRVNLSAQACSGPTSCWRQRRLYLHWAISSYPAPSCSRGQAAALFPLLMIRSLGCVMGVPLPCTSSQPDVLVSRKRVNRSSLLLWHFSFHTKQKTKACVERPGTDRCIC